MDKIFNYMGAAIFWLYIFAALALTGLVLWTLAMIESPQRRCQKSILLFSALAVLSFATISFNMLNVLVSSYTLWAREHSLNLGDTSAGSIWRWSITSNLFRDFGNAIVENTARYFWAEASLLATLSMCLHVGMEGSRSFNIPIQVALLSLSQGSTARPHGCGPLLDLARSCLQASHRTSSTSLFSANHKPISGGWYPKYL
jgi:hypothetical protein